MTKLSFDDTQKMKQKDLETILWEVFWSYAEELGVNESEEKKQEMLEKARKMIPDFAESATELDLMFDYPVVHFFLTSLHTSINLLKTTEVVDFMKVEGPDNDAKLAYLARQAQDKGVIWQSR